MSVVQAEAGWFGEGDDFFWVDGQQPSIEGTGSEDYFNDAWGLHVNDGPHSGWRIRSVGSTSRRDGTR